MTLSLSHISRTRTHVEQWFAFNQCLFLLMGNHESWVLLIHMIELHDMTIETWLRRWWRCDEYEQWAMTNSQAELHC